MFKQRRFVSIISMLLTIFWTVSCTDLEKKINMRNKGNNAPANQVLKDGSIKASDRGAGKSTNTMLSVSKLGVAAENYSEQPPLLITFDYHMDPYTSRFTPSKTERKSVYEKRQANTQWLLDLAGKYSVKLSFLAAGEYFEMCLQDKDNCFEVIKKLYASGGMIGSHSHQESFQSDFNWSYHQNAESVTEDQAKQIWDDVNKFAREVISGALNVQSDDEIKNINTANMSHVPDTHTQTDLLRSMMEEYGFTIKEGGGNDQVLVGLFGHVPFNVYRPGINCNLCEDFSTKFVVIPQSSIPGVVGEHFGIQMSGLAERKKVEILQALANRRLYALGNKGTKVWTYGWGLHGHDIDEGSTSREALEDLLPWIYEELVSKGLAKFASYPETRDAYLSWEKENPNTSSFNFPASKEPKDSNYDSFLQDYSDYQYSEYLNRYVITANYAKKIENQHIDAYSFLSESVETNKTYNVVLAMGKQGQTEIQYLDLRDIFGTDQVDIVKTGSGEKSSSASNKIAIDLEPVIICKQGECQSIVEIEKETRASSDSSNERSFGNRPSGESSSEGRSFERQPINSSANAFDRKPTGNRKPQPRLGRTRFRSRQMKR